MLVGEFRWLVPDFFFIFLLGKLGLEHGEFC